MSRMLIEGAKKLSGEVEVQGAKNSHQRVIANNKMLTERSAFFICAFDELYSPAASDIAKAVIFG